MMHKLYLSLVSIILSAYLIIAIIVLCLLFSNTGVIWEAIIGAVISHDHCIAITTQELKL